jgi:hypothetical protein
VRQEMLAKLQAQAGHAIPSLSAATCQLVVRGLCRMPESTFTERPFFNEMRACAGRRDPGERSTVAGGSEATPGGGGTAGAGSRAAAGFLRTGDGAPHRPAAVLAGLQKAGGAAAGGYKQAAG